jgi:hypothetical protein
VSELGLPGPLYVAGPRSLRDLELQRVVLESPALRARWLGVAAEPGAELPQLVELQQRFLAAYPQQDPRSARELRAAAHAYDALYLLAYGLFAAPGGPGAASAGDVLAGFQRVTDGSATAQIQVGPGAERLGAGLQLLAAGGRLRLQGVSGPCSFEPEGHTRTVQARVQAIGAEGQWLDVDPLLAFGSIAALPE